MIHPPRSTITPETQPSTQPDGYVTAWAADGSRTGNVTLVRRFRDGRVERERMHPLLAHADLLHDERRGYDVVGMWIEAGDQYDGGWTVSHVPMEALK